MLAISCYLPCFLFLIAGRHSAAAGAREQKRREGEAEGERGEAEAEGKREAAKAVAAEAVEHLRESSMHLHSRGADPLPQALRAAGRLQACRQAPAGSSGGGRWERASPSLPHQGAAAAAADAPAPAPVLESKGGEVSGREREPEQGGSSSPSQSGPRGAGEGKRSQSRGVKRSLMEPQAGARQHTWTDSEGDDEDEDEEGKRSKGAAGRRPELHAGAHAARQYSPMAATRVPHSPTGLHKQRRKRVPWSEEGVAVLRACVNRYGKSWKRILSENAAVFEGRSDVDLKDKWRNISRYE
eukprot:jgi/Mesen1/6603/ME000338S05778